MNSEKVKEIKKALEHCGEKVTCQGCPEYNNEPVIDWFKCKENLLQKTINLINELESENIQRQKLIDAYSEENERLYDDIHKKGMKGLEEQNEKNLILIDNQKDRIAELEKENKDYYDRLNNLQTYIDNHEEIWKSNTTNALKQFAERLKENNKIKVIFNEGWIFSYVEICKAIDETLKEFIDGYEN